MHKPILIVGTLIAASAFASLQFDLKDPKGVNAVTFTADSPLEPIMGFADGISGAVSFDPTNIATSRGKMMISTASVKTTNSGMTGHLQGSGWLETSKHAEMSYEVTGIREAKEAGANRWNLKVDGTLTLKGKTKSIPLDLQLTYSPGGLAKRMRGLKGDLLQVKGEFKFNRLDFELGPALAHVADDVTVTVNVVASRPEGASQAFAVTR